MAIAPFSVLAAGKIRTDAEEQRRRETGEKGDNSQNLNCKLSYELSSRAHAQRPWLGEN